MSFVIKDDDVLDKCNAFLDKIKGELNIKFHSIPVYDEKHIKAKITELNGVIKVNFLGDEIPKKPYITPAQPVWLLILLLEWKKGIICTFVQKNANTE